MYFGTVESTYIKLNKKKREISSIYRIIRYRAIREFTLFSMWILECKLASRHCLTILQASWLRAMRSNFFCCCYLVFIFPRFVVLNTGYMQAWVAGEKIQCPCKQRLNILIRRRALLVRHWKLLVCLGPNIGVVFQCHTPRTFLDAVRSNVRLVYTFDCVY